MLSDFQNREVECPADVSFSHIQQIPPEEALSGDFLSLPNAYYLLTRANPEFHRQQLWMYALKSLSPFMRRRAHCTQQEQYQYREYVKDFIEQRLCDDHEKLTVEACEIYKDLKRTQQDSEFYGSIEEDYGEKAQSLALEYEFSGILPAPLKNGHLAALLRLLLVYGRTNIEGYAQGQNELSSILYYTFIEYSNDQFEAESAAFHGMINMMRQMRALYSEPGGGLVLLLERFSHFLTKTEPYTYKQLKKEQIEPHVVIVSWILSLFSQRLRLVRCVRLWDFILAESFLLMNEEELIESFGCKESQELDSGEYITYNIGNGKNLGNDFTCLGERQWPDFILFICIYYLRQIVLKWTPQTTIAQKMNSFQDNRCFDDDCEDVYQGARQIMAKVEREFKWKKGFYKQYNIE